MVSGMSMRWLGGLSALAIVAFAGASAQAAASLDGSLSTSSSGVISAGVNASGLDAGTSVSYDFFTPTGPGGTYITVPAGNFSGSLITTTNEVGSSTDFDFGTISFINAADSSIHYDFSNTVLSGGLAEMSTIWTSLTSPAGVIAGDYFLRVIGTSRGDGSFGGQLTFNPLGVTSPVPEVASWMLMVVGFGAMGLAMRGGKRQQSLTFS